MRSQNRIAIFGRSEAECPPAQVPLDMSAVLSATARIATQNGLIAAGDLRPGTRVLTRTCGYQPINGVIVSAPEAGIAMVTLKRHALGADLPSADISVPASARILVSGEMARHRAGDKAALLPVTALIDGVAIFFSNDPAPSFAQLAFAQPQTLFVEGTCLTLPASEAADLPDTAPTRPALAKPYLLPPASGGFASRPPLAAAPQI